MTQQQARTAEVTVAITYKVIYGHNGMITHQPLKVVMSGDGLPPTTEKLAQISKAAPSRAMYLDAFKQHGKALNEARASKAPKSSSVAGPSDGFVSKAVNAITGKSGKAAGTAAKSTSTNTK